MEGEGGPSGPPNNPTFDVFDDVADERAKQDEKFGLQCGQDDYVWSAVLTEEVGETANALLCSRPGDEHDPQWQSHLRAELVQVAAVAVAWIECIDQRETT